jgi:hypothetical protein
MKNLTNKQLKELALKITRDANHNTYTTIEDITKSDAIDIIINASIGLIKGDYLIPEGTEIKIKQKKI